MAYDKDYYAVLQVSRNAKPDDIERAFRRLSATYDPSTSTKKRAAQRHADVTAAYNVLKDPRRRRQYDRQLANAAASAGSMSPADVLSNRFVMLGSGVIFAAIVVILGLVLLLGGGGSGDKIAQASPTATAARSATPGATAPASPPAVAATPVALADGLQYIIVTPGTGSPVASGQTVTVNYSGWLQDTGVLFDSSYNHGQSFSFTLGTGQVIKGWDEGVVGMLPGEKRRLIIPPDLAYGAAGHGSTIPPNSTLLFDIDLIGAGTPTPPPATPPASPPPVTGDTITTPSGLQYIIVSPGTSTETADAGEFIAVNYTGWLKDTGALFDSSLNKGRSPFTFTLGTGGVIKAWDEGVAGMKIGETRRLLVPPELGYGAAGSEPIIPPNANLIFDITLISATPAATPTASP